MLRVLVPCALAGLLAVGAHAENEAPSDTARNVIEHQLSAFQRDDATEAYSYASFKDRVLVTRDFCLAALRHTADHAKEVRTLLEDARNKTVAAGTKGEGDLVPIRSKPQAFPGKVTILGFVERPADGRSVARHRRRRAAPLAKGPRRVDPRARRDDRVAVDAAGRASPRRRPLE